MSAPNKKLVDEKTLLVSDRPLLDGVRRGRAYWEWLMHIAGGLYRELCQVPAWDAEFGSGGRAAAVLSALSPGCALHSYADDLESEGVSSLKKLGVKMCLEPRPTAIVFAYFHSLSRPHVEPPFGEIVRQPALQVSGDAVLRFGFLEGDAVVDAHRAVYDPQTWQNPAPFRDNGSRAEELAIVLNELELRSAGRDANLSSAASRIMELQQASVVVAKGGVHGATVFERGGRRAHVPAYRSPRVFKIGTGDVFSAVFSHFWAEKRISAVEAADIASRSVAAYCGSGRLPLESNAHLSRVPIVRANPGVVELHGSIATIGGRYTIEEARFVLQELGTKVICPALDGVTGAVATAVLIIADGLGEEAVEQALLSKAAGKSIVFLQEESASLRARSLDEVDITVVDDFASALYFAAWAAMTPNSLNL